MRSFFHYNLQTFNCTLRSQVGSRDGAVVRALTSQRCGSGSILGLDAICGLSLLLLLFSAPRSSSPGAPRFSSFLKNQHSQILIRSKIQWTNSHSVEVPLHIAIIIYYVNHLRLLRSCCGCQNRGTRRKKCRNDSPN